MDLCVALCSSPWLWVSLCGSFGLRGSVWLCSCVVFCDRVWFGGLCVMTAVMMHVYHGHHGVLLGKTRWSLTGVMVPSNPDHRWVCDTIK